jgi:hypothetical protein
LFGWVSNQHSEIRKGISWLELKTSATNLNASILDFTG